LGRRDLVKEADRVFSIYVRTRGESSGYNVCYTCNRSFEWQSMDAGHFMARRFLNTRWHPVNVWPQCQECNREKHGNLEVFERKLRAMFGDDAIDGLIELAYVIEKVSEDDIKQIIKKYR
jgi:hypothetical protein